MTKKELLRFLEPFDDEIEIVLSVNEYAQIYRCSLKVIYEMQPEGSGIVVISKEDYLYEN